MRSGQIIFVVTEPRSTQTIQAPPPDFLTCSAQSPPHPALVKERNIRKQYALAKWRNKKAEASNPIYDKELSTNVLASGTGKKDHGACEILRFTPTSCRDPFGYLAKADGVLEEFLIPKGERREISDK